VDYDDQSEMFAANVNELTGSEISRGEAFSLNLQYLGPSVDATSNDGAAVPSTEDSGVHRNEEAACPNLAPGHVDTLNYLRPGYDIVTTFKCYLFVDGGKYCLTNIMYSRRA